MKKATQPQRRHTLAATVLTAALACFGHITAASAQEDIKIGALVPFSGPATGWGMALAGAAELAADDANAEGGLVIRGRKHKVVVIRYDDKLRANEAVIGMNRFVYEDKVNVVLTVGSAEQLAISQMATDNKIISFTQAFSSKVLDKAFPYTFRPFFTTNEFATPQLKWLSSKLGVKKVGVLFPNDEGGQQIAADFTKSYESTGVTLVKEFYEQGREDFAPLLTRLIRQNIDSIDLDGSSPVTAGLMVKQARELGFKGNIFRTGAESTADIVNVAGKAAAEGMYVHLPANVKDPLVAPFKKRFEAKYKIPMGAGSVPFYASVKLLLAAMQKAGTTTDVDAIVKAMEDMSGSGTLIGPLGWVMPRDVAGKEFGLKRQMSAGFQIGQVRGGEVEAVATCTFAGCK